MPDWPITISEAARRLRVPFYTASVLVRAFGIPTVPMPFYHGKGLDAVAFARFEEVSRPFHGTRRNAQQVLEATAT